VILPKLIWHLEEPVADRAAIPLYYLSKLAREQVKVILCGEGGDETFAGYDRYFWNRQIALYRHLPLWFRDKIICPFAEKGLDYSPLRNLSRRVIKFTQSAELSPEERYIRWFSTFNDEDKRELWVDDIKSEFNNHLCGESFKSYFTDFSKADLLSRMQYVDLKTFLLDDLLLKADKISMAVSLEARVPFLDHNLVEYAFSLPPYLRLRGGTTKYLLRKYLKGILPADIVRRKKHGFDVPISSWFKGDLNDYAYQILSEEGIKRRGYFNCNYIRKLLSKLEDGQINIGQQIYTLIILELWHQVFIDQQ